VKSFKDFVIERHKGLDWRTTEDGTVVARNHRHHSMNVGASNATNPNMKHAERIVPHALKTKDRPYKEMSPGESKIVGYLTAQKIAVSFQSNLPETVGEIKRFKSSGYSLTKTQNGFIFKKDKI